jgi:hypothetical protein
MTVSNLHEIKVVQQQLLLSNMSVGGSEKRTRRIEKWKVSCTAATTRGYEENEAGTKASHRKFGL